MTLLIGTIQSTGDPSVANGMSGTRLIIRDFIASATGSLETISYLDNTSDDNVVFVVYSAAGSFLGKTNEVAPATGVITGTLTAPIPITNGVTYKIGAYCKDLYFHYLTDNITPSNKYDGGTYLTPASTITTDEDYGISQLQFWGSGTLGASYSIDSITTPLVLGTSGNSITTTNLGTLTSLTIGGKAVSNLSAPSGDGTFSIPAWTDGVEGFAIGTGIAVIAGDGTNTANSTVTINPPSNHSAVTLTSNNTSVGYLGNQITLGVGWQIIFPTAASLGVTTNYIDVDGGIYTDYVGSQTLYARNNSTGMVSQITLINGVVAPSKYAMLWFFGA